jgi:hypothetical protein
MPAASIMCALSPLCRSTRAMAGTALPGNTNRFDSLQAAQAKA